MEQCENCSKPCILACSRCKTRYCSLTCQLKLWPTHRQQCLTICLQKRGLSIKSESQDPQPPVFQSTSPASTVITPAPQKRGLSIKSESQDPQPSDFQTTSPASPVITPAPPPAPVVKPVPPEIFEPIKTPVRVPNTIKSTNQRNANTPSKQATSYKIAITSFIRSNCVYIRDADDETSSRFQMIHRVVEQLAKNLSQIKSLPKEGSFLIATSYDGFKRCIVQEVKGERHIKVFMSDSGRQEIVRMDQLFEPGHRLEKLAETSFIKMLKLENVPEFYLNKKAAEYVKSVLGDNIFLELEYGSQPDEGRIFDVVKNEYINDVLFCYAQEDNHEMVEYEPEDKEFTFITEEIVKIDSLPKKELPQEAEVSLMIYNNSQLEKNYIISCVNIDDLGEIKEIIKDIHDYGTKNEKQTYKPENDDVCIAFYLKKKKWCRARILEICEENPEEAMVCFFDFGKNVRVPLQKVIKYPEAFSYLPNYLYTCRVFGLPQHASEELLERLHELLPENASVKAKSLSVVDTNFHLIEMDAILKILAIEDLI